jgi:hypothetical protein
MSRTFVVAALAAGFLIGSGACGPAQAEPAVKSSKHDTSRKTKPSGQGQSVGPTRDQGNGSNAGSRADSEYGR